MGFFNVMQRTKGDALPASLETLHKLQCSACPLNCISSNKNPHMKPTGAKKPVVYMLGEAPGADEDYLGKQFVGASGEALHMRIPDEWLQYLRWNNVVRTRPPKNRNPTPLEIECCRPSIVADIEATKPAAIFGFGNIPLMWALRETGITKWTGRHIPVQIGSHKCWYFPFVHPSAIIRGRKFEPRRKTDYGSDDEFAFAMHLKQAFKLVDKGLPEPVIHTKEFAQQDIEIVTGHNEGDLDRVLDFLEDCDANETDVGFDWETNKQRPYWEDSKILTAAISGKHETLAFAVRHSKAGWSETELDTLEYELEHWLINARCKKISHALNFEAEWAGVKFGKKTIRPKGGRWEDTLTQSYVIDERRGTHDLDMMCVQYFGLHLKEISGLDRKNLDQCMIESVLQYNGLDAKYHRNVFLAQRDELKRLKMEAVYEEALARVPTVVLTQMKGIPIHQPTVLEFKKKYEKQQRAIENKLFDLPEVERYEKKHGEFSPSSGPQVTTLLGMLGYRDLENIDEKTLEKIGVPFTDLLLEWRGVAKNLSTYIKPVLPGSPVLFPGDMAHPILSTTTVVTWRTSSKDFNSQNWPKHGEQKEVRRQSKAPKGFKYVSFDYAGIQARNVAMESRDKTLVQAFWENYDVHADWRDQTIDLYPRWIKEGMKEYRLNKDVQKAYRQTAKNGFVFPSFFGAYPKKIGESLGIPVDIAEKLRDRFWKRFPQIKDWHDNLREFYDKHGYVTGLSGFRRHAPVASTELINTPIQSDEAIIVCGAMNRLSQKGDHDLQANMEIHDDLTFLWPEDRIDELMPIAAKEMTKIAYPWMGIVPIEVEMSIGDNWCDMKEQKHLKLTSVELWGHKRSK